MLTWTLYLPVWDCSFLLQNSPITDSDVVEDERGEEVLPDAYFACPAEYLDLQLVLGRADLGFRVPTHPVGIP